MSCPYTGLPDTSWWTKAVGSRAASEVDPHLPATLAISRDMRVASAGSCFAQHISRALVARGFNYHVTERAPAFMPREQAERFGYNVFSARYGNIYTTLQFNQLVQRALGDLQPADQFWTDRDGRVFDLLRPRIVPGGFSSMAEARADQQMHLRAVRHCLESADVFVFTLGLTECWVSTADGIAYPTCPGCGSAGAFDPARYAFHNLTAAETSANLSEAIARITGVNPSVQIVLTVSPVPLIATMEARHVLQATTYSKSVLRVSAEEVVRRFSNVHYFASYEIITATRNTHNFIADDGRTVTDTGVSHVMDIFFRHFTDTAAPEPARSEPRPDAAPHDPAPPVGDVVCDEAEFYRALTKASPQ